MPNLKKVFLSLLTSIILFSGSVAPTLAAWYDQSLQEFSTKVFDKSNNDIFGERYTFAQVSWIGYSLITLMIGDSGKNIVSLDNSTNKIGYQNSIDDNSVIGASLNIVGLFYSNMPASGVHWLSDRLSSFQVVNTAVAASPGFGFSALSAFQSIWRASRNTAYLLAVLVVIVASFAIMFRAKINPQTVISIQTMLPRFVTAIILITFSYAIAGFFIDLMYLVFYVIVYALGFFGGIPSASGTSAELVAAFTNGSTTDLLGFVIGKGIAGITSAFGGALAVGGVGAGAGVGIASALGAPLSATALIPIVLSLLIAIIVFLVKLIIMLAQTYLSLAFNIIAGPFIILFDVIPSKSNGTLKWMSSLLADVLVFLFVGMVIFFQSILINTIDVASSLWGPPYLGGSPSFLKGIIALGAISILPNARQLVYQLLQKRALEITPPREFGQVSETISKQIQMLQKRP